MSQYIKEECAGSDSSRAISIRLEDFTPFQWDTLYPVWPYSTMMKTVKQVGLDGSMLACSRSRFYDEWTQLVFTLDGARVTFFDVSTSLVVSSGFKSQFSVEDAQFSVYCPDAGAI